MSDVLTPSQRSYCMSRIKGKNTVPELRLRKALWSAGYRYRIKNRLPGKPDLVFVGAKVAVFVDGCFWHGCPVHATHPKLNADFWTTKLKRNICRDKEVNKVLTKEGWVVVRVWEHELKDDIASVVHRISLTLQRGIK
ncbi:MAG: very short patch repair endonuclease [Thermodesulfobacteriota bacterium]